jgi:hypothetical protein
VHLLNIIGNKKKDKLQTVGAGQLEVNKEASE